MICILFGLRPTKGVLLHGPPDTGKTSLAQLSAHDIGVNLFTVNEPEIVSQNYGESEQALHRVFDFASQATPAVVFVDELDAIAPARKDGGEELSQRMVATLLNLIDGISRVEGLLVIAATNRPDSIEPALTSFGDLTLSFGRANSTPCHGHTWLCNEAALVCLRRYSKFNVVHSCRTFIANEGHSDIIVEESGCSINYGDSSRNRSDFESSCASMVPISSEILPYCHVRAVSETADNFQNGVNGSSEGVFILEEEFTLKVTFEDFEKARMKVRPSAMREV
ncbi:hypothetical protein Dsin_000659 [Dipteronia sinensis]|uniref:AAA+ ATPase domain-containing protein n=1 Tax=Dipteronia sinensis TaxID=43782 RepID=A0AAE0B2G7_9ROSI|nr:hypothetical protein Dsin_000659 [Dipteronia sinensis]